MHTTVADVMKLAVCTTDWTYHKCCVTAQHVETEGYWGTISKNRNNRTITSRLPTGKQCTV